MYEKAIAGSLGTLGVSYAAYKLMFPWLGQDVHDVRTVLKIRRKFYDDVNLNRKVVDTFEEVATRTPDKYFIIYNDRIYTYGQLLEQANRISHVAKSWNLRKGEAVAIFMENEPAYMGIFFGLQKVGIPVALINHNLRSGSLEHCLKSVDAKVIITGAGDELLSALSYVQPSLQDTQIFSHGLPADRLPYNFQSLSDLAAAAPATPLGKDARAHCGLDDPCVYIYTSGTTGLPKPALITQTRVLVGLHMMPTLAKMTADDVVYIPVPLYHTSGFFVGALGVIGTGCTMVLRKKFSASHYWEDCCRHKVTVIQYIGEIIRYILSQPETSRDRRHCVRVAIGNGLRTDIWEKFQKRYRISHIIEFFAATEGTSLLLNLHNHPGGCGRYSPLVQLFDPYPKYLVKFEPGTDQPLRDKNGRCIKVKRGEPGLLIASYPPYVKPEDTYKASKDAIEKKLARNVFKEGDVYFNYGDLLYLDKDYFFHFADRVGDTFRWKGENVSTQEVANVLSSLDFILDANVYGVEIPGQDGRAGMACLVLNDSHSSLTGEMCQAVFKKVKDALPSYARPLFLRLQPGMELTGTYKQRKVELVKEGFDPKKINDPLYCLDTAKKSYVPLTDNQHTRILVGQSRL